MSSCAWTLIRGFPLCHVQMFTVKCDAGVKAASFAANDKVYVNPEKLLPMVRFTNPGCVSCVPHTCRRCFSPCHASLCACAVPFAVLAAVAAVAVRVVVLVDVVVLVVASVAVAAAVAASHLAGVAALLPVASVVAASAEVVVVVAVVGLHRVAVAEGASNFACIRPQRASSNRTTSCC